ncbi:MAG: vWA domain-containing protein [Planctomycetota bacterium]
MPNPILRLIPLLSLLATAPAQDGQSQFGHARARALAALGRLPSAREVVVRDLVNYHRHRLPLPRPDQAVALDLRFDRAEAGVGDEVLVQVGYTTAPEGDRSLAPPCAVVLVVDCSGSMRERGKLDQVRQGLRAFVERLRDDDRVALVAFADEARVVLPPQRCADGEVLDDALQQLRADGNTNLHQGLLRGLELLDDTALSDLQRRLIVLTDGIANAGVHDPGRIATEVATRADAAGVDVSTIGLGANLDAAVLQQLAQQNRGLCHFVGDARDVQKVFVREADSLLVPAARHVHLHLRLPDELELLHVFDRHQRKHQQRVRWQLDDLNAGATGVALLRCRVRRTADRPLVVVARIGYRDPRTAQATEHDARSALAAVAVPAPDARTDLEVRRNAAIATLAEGLHAMARRCDGRRWADADRELRDACDAARALFPGDDPDVDRVREIVDGHLRTLQNHLDRFRRH